MPKYWASEAARAAAAAQPSIAMGWKDRSSKTTNTNSAAPRPCAIALAVCIALGLSACGGGGGGGNVKSNPPPTTPSTPPVDTSPLVVSSDLLVKSGETIARPIVIEGGAGLDNQGSIGGTTTKVGIEAKAPSIIENHAGGTIRGAETAIRLDHGGEIRNDAGATIAATSTRGTDCGANVRCAIYAGQNDGIDATDFDFTLTNAGTIVGDVRTDPASRNSIELVAGSSIQGDLDLGSTSGYTFLRLGGDAGTTERLSEAVTGDIRLYRGNLWKIGQGTWIIDRDWGTVVALAVREGRLEIVDGGPDVDGDVPFGYSMEVHVNDGELVFNRSDDMEIRVQISGNGALIKDGTGTLTMLGGYNFYSGGTTINAGELRAWNLPGSVAVNPASTLQAWSVDADLSNSGTVVVTDERDVSVFRHYSQASTGTLAVSLGSKLAVSGTATLDGTLKITGANTGYVANTHTEVLTAGGGVNGTFAQLVKGPGVVFTSTTINYDTYSVWLDTTGLNITTAAAGDGVGYTPASMSAAVRTQGAFEQLNDRIATNSLAGVSTGFLQSAGLFQQAASIEAAQASLRSLSGQLHAASAAMTFRAIDAGNQALSDHLDGLRDGNAAFGMWTQQLGSGGGMARSGFDGVGFQMNGWLVGNDYRLGRSGVVGFAFGQGQGVQQLQAGADRDTSRRTEGMIYAGTGSDRWYAQGRLGFGQFRQDVNRQLLLGDTAEGVWTRYGGRYQVAYAESGLRWHRGAVRIAPFASMEYARSERDAFAEEGAGGFGLRSDAQATSRWQASAGLRAARQWNFGKGRSLDVGAHAQWFRTLGATDDAMDASFVGLQQWSPLLGIGLSRHGSLAGVGLDARLSPNAMFKLSYDYEQGQYDSAHGMSAGLNVAF